MGTEKEKHRVPKPPHATGGLWEPVQFDGNRHGWLEGRGRIAV